MEWSALEHSVHRLAWCLAGLKPNLGRCITQHVAFGAVWDSILSMSIELDLPAERQSELKALHSQCAPLRLRRNEVVHALWGVTAGTNLSKGELTAIVAKARGKLKVDMYNYTTDFMHELAGQISQLSLAIATQAMEPPGGKVA